MRDITELIIYGISTTILILSAVFAICLVMMACT